MQNCVPATQSIPTTKGMKKDRSKKPASKRRPSKRSTIHDVAEAAGVSIYAVSRTLNNKPGVNPEIRERILQESRRLGVRPRPVSKRKHFAMIIPDRGRFRPGAYVSNMTFEILEEVSSRGMGLSLFHDSDFDQLSRQVFDGLFVMSWDPGSIARLPSLTDTPIVVINRFSLRQTYHVVGWDHYAEGRAVGEYLFARGHRRTGFVFIAPAQRHSTQSRLRGLREAFAQGGAPLDPRLAETLESTDQLIPALQRMRERGVDSLYFPGQEGLGMQALRHLQRIFGLRIPDDLSIVAGENAGWSALTDPPLTTVDAPLGLLARHCVDHMIRLMEKRSTEPTEVLIATDIIERMTVRDRLVGAETLPRGASLPAR